MSKTGEKNIEFLRRAFKAGFEARDVQVKSGNAGSDKAAEELFSLWLAFNRSC